MVKDQGMRASVLSAETKSSWKRLHRSRDASILTGKNLGNSFAVKLL
jgi:hypothetical protein